MPTVVPLVFFNLQKEGIGYHTEQETFKSERDTINNPYSSSVPYKFSSKVDGPSPVRRPLKEKKRVVDLSSSLLLFVFLMHKSRTICLSYFLAGNVMDHRVKLPVSVQPKHRFPVGIFILIYGEPFHNFYQDDESYSYENSS